MMARCLFWLWWLPLIASCSFLGRGDDALTIESLESRTVEYEPGLALDSSQEKAMQSYQQYLEVAPNDETRVESMRRVADLQFEITQEHELEGSDPAPEGGNYREAIRLYKELLDAYPDASGNDRVLYQLSRAYEHDNQPDEALATLDRLVRQYPRTAYIDEAQFRRGEVLFVRGAYPEAGRAYQVVLDVGESSPYYEQALYKQGWSLFRQLSFEEGLNAFFGVLDRKLGTAEEFGGESDLQNMTRAERELLEDSFRVVSLSFTYLAGPESVDEYLESRDKRPYEYLIYENLGDFYLYKRRFNDAAKTYRAFVDRNPVHAQAPLLQVRVIDAYREGQFGALVLESKQEFVGRYGMHSTFWEVHDPANAPIVLGHLKTNLIDLARHYHAQAQRSKRSQDYRQAAHWYRSYLNSFPDDKEAPGMSFLLAEILYEDKQYREATLQYERTAYDYPSHDKGAEAGYAALLAYKEHEKQLKGHAKAQWHRQSIDSSLRFADRYATHPQAAAVLTKAAENLFALKEFEGAIAAAEGVLARQPAPDATLQRTAWTVLAHSEFDRGTFDRAETAYIQTLRLTPKADAKRGALVERLASAVYKQGEQQRGAGDLAAAVEHFLRVKTVAPTATIVAAAEYDAAAALITLEDWTRAATVLEDFRASYPNHELQAEVDRKLAAAYLNADRPMKAAVEFERIGRTSKQQTVRQEATWQAATLYEKAHANDKAVEVYERYVKQFPRPLVQAVEGRQRLVELYEGAGDSSASRFWLNEIIVADEKAGSERTERTRYLAAKAAFTLAEPSFQAFERTRLVIPLKKSLKQKKSRMEQALEAFGRAADYGIAEVTTAATYHIAEIYNSFGRSLMQSERPKNLSPEELEQYEILLEEQAYPFEEQAIGVHETNVKWTVSGIYDAWVKKSFTQLAELLPVRYAKSERSESIVQTVQ